MPKPHTPHVPGADGAGVIDAIGGDVDDVAVGDEVVINPAVACRQCSYCLAGDSPYCKQFGILGEHRWGTHAEFVVVPAANVVPKPATLDWPERPRRSRCAGSPRGACCKRARLNAADTMIVVGVGGGVSTRGARPRRCKRSDGVRHVARRGQAGPGRRDWAPADAFDSNEPWPVQADVVFENVGAATWNNSIRALKPGGRLVTCGGTAGSNVEISLPRLFFKQHEIIGSTMGSYAEFDEVLETRGRRRTGRRRPGVRRPERLPEALERLEAGDQTGKIVIRH